MCPYYSSQKGPRGGLEELNISIMISRDPILEVRPIDLVARQLKKHFASKLQHIFGNGLNDSKIAAVI